MHFMNPVPMNAARGDHPGLATSDETYRVTEELSVKMGKTPVKANDFPGSSQTVSSCP